MKDFETRIIQLFLDINFSWKDTLINQLKHAKVKMREQYDTNYFICFSVDRQCDMINVDQVVPIEIIVDHEQRNSESVVYNVRQEISLHQYTLMSPSGMKLYIKNGFLTEMEVYSLGGDALQLEKVCEGKRYYFLLCR